LGRTQTFVFVVPHTSSAKGVSVTVGTHTGTDCVVNAPTTTTFVVIAF
jgi:mRNA-degrading endonuclease toxin of MazEF toxin-antitoxin module